MKMHNWTIINTDSIGVYLSPFQLTALRQFGDPLQHIIADIVAWVRSEIQTNPNNAMSEDPTLVPDSLKTVTCALVIEALQSRIPSLKLTDDQVRNANNARLHLKRVANAQVAISPYSPTSNIAVASSRKWYSYGYTQPLLNIL